jgi:hypothetical protein
MLEFATDRRESFLFSVGFVGTVASILVGGVVATVTVVGLVSNTVDSHPENPASVSGSSSIQYGAR